MENITFENFQDTVSKTIINKAKKLLTRDLEEVSPNKYLAYIDEGSQSYDVGIEFVNKEIKSLTCDCENNIGMCVHKVALVNFLKKEKTVKSVAVKRKKSESELLLEQLDENSLRVWTQELFKKNKDIEFLFVNEFTKSEIVYDQKEVKAIIDKAIKSVIKSKKSIDNTELKRIIDVLEVSLKPVLKFAKENISLPETYDLFVFIYSELYDFNERMYISSIKLIRFIEKLYKEINLHIQSISNETLWRKTIEQITNTTFDKKGVFTLELEAFFNIYDSIDKKERRAFFANIMFDLHTITVNKNIRFIKSISFFMIKVFTENKLFEKVHMHFAPIRFENDFNVFLIEKLIEIKKYNEAEAIAIDQIEGNYHERYNLDYYKLLTQIYTLLGDEKKMALLQMRLIFYDFSLDAYKSIQIHCEESDFKKFRTKLLSALKRDFYGNKKAVANYFEILSFEKKYKNMIDTISEYTSYELIYNYKEELFLFDKLPFLLALTNIEKNSYYSSRKDKTTLEYRNKFLIWIKEKYDQLMIQTVVKNKKQYFHSDFIHELETNLKIV
jgi:hypothetical protein